MGSLLWAESRAVPGSHLCLPSAWDRAKTLMLIAFCILEVACFLQTPLTGPTCAPCFLSQ